MPDHRSAGLFTCLAIFLASAALNLAWLGRAPVSDTTEARHAEVAREFATEGHWLVPTHNGWPHLTKPPLTDWIAAAGMRLFGVGEFGARFGNALIAALTVALTAALAGRLGGRRAALAAAVALAACPLHLALSRVISIDVLLAALSAGFYLVLWDLCRPAPPTHPARVSGRTLRWLRLVALGLILGAAAMAKGHVALLLMFAPGLAWALIFAARSDSAPSRWRIAAGAALVLAVAAAVAAPWFAYVMKTFPGWLHTITHEELGERLSGKQFGRAFPGTAIGYFLAGCLTALPLALAALIGRRKVDSHEPETRNSEPGTVAPRGALSLLILWIAVPLAAFSLAVGQRMNYVEPLMPAVAVLAGLGWCRLAPAGGATLAAARRLALATAGLPVALGLAVLGVLAVRPDAGGLELTSLQGIWLAVAAAATALAGVVGVLALRRARLPLAAGALAAAAVGLSMLAVPATEAYQAQHSTRESCRWLAAHARPGEPVFCYREYAHSSGFYLGERVPVVIPGGDTEVWASAWPQWSGAGARGPVPIWDELSRVPGIESSGAWALVPPGRLQHLQGRARKAGLSVTLHQVDRDVILAHLEPSAPGRN